MMEESCPKRDLECVGLVSITPYDASCECVSVVVPLEKEGEEAERENARNANTVLEPRTMAPSTILGLVYRLRQPRDFCPCSTCE